MPAYGNTLRTLAKFPRHKAVIPSCCTIEPISRLILARVNFLDVCTWNNIFTLSAGATVVFATIPATPPETNLTNDVVLLFWVLLFLFPSSTLIFARRFGAYKWAQQQVRASSCCVRSLCSNPPVLQGQEACPSGEQVPRRNGRQKKAFEVQQKKRRRRR